MASVPGKRKPIRLTLPGCCARAASGHAAAAPPSSVMNSRRLIIQSPRRRGRATSAAHRFRGPWRPLNYQFILGRILHRKLGGLLTFEYATGVDACLPNGIIEVRSITHQTASLHIAPVVVAHGNAITRRQCGELIASRAEKCVHIDEKSMRPLLGNC